MDKVILLRYGELYLKGKNRNFFERLLMDSIKARLKDVPCSLYFGRGRYVVSDYPPQEEADIIAMTKYFMVVDAVFGVLLTGVNVFRFCMQGLGYSGLAIFAGVLEMIGRSAVAFLLIPVFGFSAACFVAPAAWLLADLFLIPTCFGCIRKLAGRVRAA